MANHVDATRPNDSSNGYATVAVVLGVLSLFIPAIFIPTLLLIVLAKARWARSGAGADLIRASYVLAALAIAFALVRTMSQI